MRKVFAENFRTKPYPGNNMFLLRERFFVEISFSSENIINCKLKYFKQLVTNEFYKLKC